jgi:hypothetical protein
MALTPFLITIDTEEDNAWGRRRQPATENAAFLERFQQVCERWGLRPTWLATQQMVMSPTFRKFAADVISRGTAEIGMHLHAWNSPPLTPLTDDDVATAPYLIEYPPTVMREKIRALTASLEDTFGIKMVSHRAGRWAFDARYAEMLLEEGYKLDCSVTPLVNWATTLGDPSGHGGTNYTSFRHDAYWIDLHDVASAGTSDLLEVPMTIFSFRSRAVAKALGVVDALPATLRHLRPFAHKAANRLSPEAVWLRPNGHNGQMLQAVVERVLADRLTHAQFMLHSSELMPGGSPTFQDEASIEKLYEDVEALFRGLVDRFRGRTLSEFHDELALARSANSPGAHSEPQHTSPLGGDDSG